MPAPRTCCSLALLLRTAHRCSTARRRFPDRLPGPRSTPTAAEDRERRGGLILSTKASLPDGAMSRSRRAAIKPTSAPRDVLTRSPFLRSPYKASSSRMLASRFPRRADPASRRARFIRFVQAIQLSMEGQFKLSPTVAFDRRTRIATADSRSSRSIDMGTTRRDRAKTQAWLTSRCFQSTFTRVVKASVPGTFTAGKLTSRSLAAGDAPSARLAGAAPGAAIFRESPPVPIVEGPWAVPRAWADEVLVRFRFVLPTPEPESHETTSLRLHTSRPC